MEISAEGAALLGHDRSLLRATPEICLQHVPPEDLMALQDLLQGMAHEGPDTAYVRHQVVLGGSIRRVEVYGKLERDSTGLPVRLSGALFEVDRQAREAEPTRQNGDANREAAAAEEVYRKVGRDLHDGLSQTLSSASFLSVALANMLSLKSAPEAPDAALLADLLEDALEQTRCLGRTLAAADLERRPLAEALRCLGARAQQTYKVRCSVAARRIGEGFSAETALHLYRIAQEAVQNALRHGSPQHIHIALTARGRQVELSVRDDGKGIPEGTAPGEGMGLRSMRQRAELIGARFDFSPGSRGGMVVRCVLPRPV